MDRLANMQTFVEVVDGGGISAAAERLGVAKSAVSRRLAELEEHLGVQLLRRTTRRVNLTDTGRSFYERCQVILAEVQDAELAVSQEHRTPRGRLRVAAPLSFGLLHLGPAICDFMQAYPQVTFDLDFNDRQVDLIAEGYDVALRIAELSDSSSLIARRLAPVRMVVCASPGYLARAGAPATPGELARHTCFAYSNLPDPSLWRYRDAHGRDGTVRIRPTLQANNGQFLHQVALAGHGIVLQPTFIVFESIQSGRLKPLLTDYTWSDINAYAVYPRTRHLSRRVRAFVDFLADRFQGTPYWDCVP